MLAPIVGFGSESDWDDGLIGRESEPQTVTALSMLRGAAFAGVFAVLLFLAAPELDTTVARAFYIGDGHFVGTGSWLFGSLRAIFNNAFYLTCALTVAGLIAGKHVAPWLGLRFSKWLFLALCLIIGPLVVTNIGLKDHWGRARPRDVVEFGGTRQFTPPFPPSTNCARNCSFVSGEASSVYIVFFALAFLFKRNARNMVRLGIGLGSLAGLTRMAEGGHFLSDVIFAGILMAATAACIELLFDAIKTASCEEIAEASEWTAT